jgi:hypothetical protein
VSQCAAQESPANRVLDPDPRGDETPAMTTGQIPQRDAADLFLAMIAGRDTTGFYEIRSALPERAGMRQTFIALNDREHAASIAVNQGQRTDTYIGLAPRSSQSGGLAAIPRVWCIWADCDTGDSLRRLAAFRPLPSIAIRSGSDDHVHGYWPLRDAVAPEWAKRANRRLALALTADRGATDGARIMRLPGTYNHKHAAARPVVCTRLELDVFTIGQVVGALPDDPAYAPRVQRPDRTAHVSPSKVVAGLTRTVREAESGKDRNSRLFWAACRVAERDDLDVEGSLEALRVAATDVGLPDHEIDRTLASALDRRVIA